MRAAVGRNVIRLRIADDDHSKVTDGSAGFLYGRLVFDKWADAWVLDRSFSCN